MPDALLNYLVRLGWSHGDQEIFSREEMIELFEIDAINASAASFNTDKLNWLNQQYLLAAPLPQIVALVIRRFERLGIGIDPNLDIAPMVDLYRQRVSTINQLADSIRYCFEDFDEYDPKAATKTLKAGAVEPPVIEAYGMTEATHQMCANPLPPLAAKPRSVGVATGIDLAVLDSDGHALAPGERGEVSIRGATVIDGYENNPEANESAFTDGWFRTGDEGYLDDDGYLFLTGRLKEQINRGGEKVSPLEVDEALLRHPSVAQAVTFARPHPKLGEEVAAAVVAADGASVDERELRRFVAESLAAFKVPRRILVLDELPKGPTGKLQRIGLAERLGLTSD